MEVSSFVVQEPCRGFLWLLEAFREGGRNLVEGRGWEGGGRAVAGRRLYAFHCPARGKDSSDKL